MAWSRGNPGEGPQGEGVRAPEVQLRQERQLWLRHHRAHRPRHQVRSEHGHLWHGLLRAPLAAWWTHPEPEAQEGQDRIPAQAEKGGWHEVVPDEVRWHHLQQLKRSILPGHAMTLRGAGIK